MRHVDDRNLILELVDAVSEYRFLALLSSRPQSLASAFFE